MDALFQTQSNELSTITQKEKLFKDAERQWNTLSTEKGAPGRKVDFEIYKSILYNLEIRKVYLDSKLSLEKFSSIVGTNTTYLSNAVNNYFGCNFKRLINSYRVARAKELLDGKDCPVSELFSRCGFASKSVFYVAFRKVVGMTPLQYISQSRNPFMIQREASAALIQARPSSVASKAIYHLLSLP